MQLRVFDEKKRTQYKFKENEGLQFAFDIEADKAEEVVAQMIEQQHIPDVDTKMIIKMIKDKVDNFKRDREQRHNDLKRQRDEEERKKEEQAVKEELQARKNQREAAALAAQQQEVEPIPEQVLPEVPKEETDGLSSTQTTCNGSVKKAKKKIILEVLDVQYNDGCNQPLVSCKMDTAQKTVTFRFAPDSDQPTVIATKLMDQDCLSEPNIGVVIEQLEKVIEVVKENPEKSIGLKLTSVVEQQSDSVNKKIVPMDVQGVTSLKAPVEVPPQPPQPTAQPVKAGRFSVTPSAIVENTTVVPEAVPVDKSPSPAPLAPTVSNNSLSTVTTTTCSSSSPDSSTNKSDSTTEPRPTILPTTDVVEKVEQPEVVYPEPPHTPIPQSQSAPFPNPTIPNVVSQVSLEKKGSIESAAPSFSQTQPLADLKDLENALNCTLGFRSVSVAPSQHPASALIIDESKVCASEPSMESQDQATPTLAARTVPAAVSIHPSLDGRVLRQPEFTVGSPSRGSGILPSDPVDELSQYCCYVPSAYCSYECAIFNAMQQVSLH